MLRHTLISVTPRLLVASLILAGLLTCGGGGGGNAAPQPAPAVGTAPTITTQPADAVVVEGTTATFAVTASGSPAPSIQWERTNDGTTWQAVAGVVQAQLTFTPVAQDSGARFRAVATNSLGTARSQPALLTVSTHPTFTAQPQARTVDSGDNAVFLAAAGGNPPPMLQWQRSADGLAWTPLVGETGGQFTLTAQPSDDGAQFRVLASNGVGDPVPSLTATLTVLYAPVLTTQPQSQTVQGGGLAAFSVLASGDPAPTYQWQRSDDGATWQNIAGETRPGYTLPLAQSVDGGSRFRVVATNALASTTSEAATLTVSTVLPAGGVQVAGVLHLPAGSQDALTDHVIYNGLQSVSPQGDGSFQIAIAGQGLTTTYAVHKPSGRTYVAITAGAGDPLVIDSGSTAEALVFLNPLLVPRAGEERARILELVRGDMSVGGLAAAIETLYPSAPAPLSDPRLREASRGALLSVMSALQAARAQATPAANSPANASLRRSPGSLVMAGGQATSGGSLQIINKDMGVLTLAGSSGTTLQIHTDISSHALGEAHTNVDWVARIIELDPAKLTWVNGVPNVVMLTPTADALDAVTLAGGFQDTTLVEGQVASGNLAWVVDPLETVLDGLVAKHFPDQGIELPHAGVYAVVVLSGSPFGDSAEMATVTGWQKDLWRAALASNIFNISLDSLGVITTIGSAGTSDPDFFKNIAGETYPLLMDKVLASENPGATFITENTLFTMDKLIEALEPEVVPDFSSIQSLLHSSIGDICGHLLNVASSALDVWQGSVAASSRALGIFFEVTPREVAYAVVGSPANQVAPPAPEDLSATQVSALRVALAWSPDPPEANVAGYRIYRDGAQLAETTGTSWVDSLTADQALPAYSVAAFDASGNLSTPCAPQTPPPGGTPFCPREFTAAAQPSGVIQLSWVDQAYDEYGFVIERRTGATGTYARIAVPAALPMTGSTGTFLDMDTVLGVTYGYRIHAMNGFGMDSVGLETTCVAQASGASAPGAFTLAAPAAVCSNGGPEVDLTWTASQSATTYDLYRDGALYKSGATAGTAFSNIANLAPGQHCTYQVVARNASGTTPSNTVDVLIPQDVCTASLPTVPAGTTPGDPAGPGPVLGSVTATLTWGQADRATLYEVTVRDLASGALVVDTTTTALSAPVTLDAGKPYRWSVAAGNAAGFSAYSSPDYFQTPGLAVPSAPTGLAPGGSSAPGTTVTTLTPTLFWTASSGAASYAVVVVDVGTQAKILAQAVPGTSVVCPSLTQGRTYAWSVSASNASGTGVAAPLVFFTVAAQGGTVPAVPTGLAPGGSSAPGTTVTTLTPTLSWTASQGATSYAVVVVDAGSQAQVLAQSVSGTSVVCPSLTLGRTYAWSVSASNASGTGVAAPLVFFTVAAQGGTVPAVPTGLAPGGSSAPGTTVTTLTPTLSWTASQGATSYAVVVVDAGSQAQVLAQSVSGTSVVCPSLTLGRTYAWSVSASNTAGTSAAAPLAFFTTNVPPATHQVSGTVKGGAAGWTLQLQTGSGASLTSTTTSANGAYAFSGLSDGAYTVLAPNVNGWVISPSQISVTVSGADATADFTATGTNIYSVSGAVTGAASAAVLTLVGTTGTLSQVTTSGNGSFAFNGLASGNYTVTPSSSGLVFSPTSAAVSVGPAPGSATNVNFAATPRTASDVTTIPTGLYPKALTVDPANGKVYSANGDGTATIIDGTTDAPVSVGVGLGSVAVVANPASLRAYVANFNGGTVSVLDGTTNAVVATVPVTGLPQALALDPAGNRVYALGQGGVVSVVDGNSNSVAATITAGTGPDAAAVSPVDRKVYVANGGSNTVTVMDASNAVAATLAVGSVPVAVLAHPTMNLVYVLNFGDADVTVLDGAALKATATVPVGKGPVGMVFNPNHNKIYVVDRDGCALSVIDAGTQKVLATVPMGKYPVAAAVNTTTDKVYVVNQTDATVTVVDSFTDAVMTTVAVGAAPAAVAVNVLNNKVYVANSGASSLALIDGSTYHISGKVTGTSQPLTFTLANAAGGIITTATTDASGAFSFSGLVNATYTVIAPVVAGYVVSPAQVPVSVGGGDGMVSFSAASLSTYSILGTVSGAPSGVAVGLADATGATVATVWTDAGGGYAFQSLASGTYTVTPVLAHFAFTPSSVPVSVAGSTAATVDFKASPTWPTAVTTVTTGGNPELMVVNPSNNKIYIEKSDGTMTVVNGATHGTTSMPLGQGPAGMALVPCTLRVVVAESNAGSVSIVDCTSDTVMATLQVGQFPGAVGANVSNGKVYVVNTSGGTVSVIDTYANTVQATVQVGQSPCAVAVNSSDGKAYVANASSNTVSILDGSNKVVATVAAGSLPNAIALEASKNKVYAINFGDNTLTVIDGASAQAVATVSVGRGPQALVTNPGNHKVYVANQDGTVTVIDAGSDTVLATVTVGSAPVSLDLDPTTNQVYVVNQISNTVTVIDGTTDQATLQVNVGQTPKAVAVNPNDHKVYVTNQSAGTLSVFDGASYRVTGTCQGAVASGVSVTLTGPNVPALTALSDANGAFVLPCIVDGTYTLTPVKTGFTFTPASLSLTLKDADGSVNFIATAAP